MARELNQLAETWQGYNTASATPPTEERAAAIEALLRLPTWHLIYLLTFDPPRTIEKVVPLPDFSAVSTWVELLGAEPPAVVEELQHLGALVRADLATHLIVRDFTRTELQTMLRVRQLPISGNKEELLERLVQADEPGMWTALADLRLWQCTPWVKDKAKTRLEEVLAAKSTDEGQSAISAPMREVIKWILLTSAAGVVGNRTDAALFGNDSTQSCDTDSSSPPDTDTISPLPTPQTDTLAPEPQPEPPGQSTPIPRSTPIPPMTFDWVTIPAGEFWMGSDKSKDPLAHDDETPQHKVYLPTYRIARVPVTNAQYELFVAATGYQLPGHWQNGQIPNGKENHPVVYVSWHDAMAFCEWAGVCLPSEAEWEKAARSTDGRIYPWGNEAPDRVHCNFNQFEGDTMPVDHYTKGQSFYGTLDMVGNVWEWTHSLYRSYPYKLDDGREDPVKYWRRMLRGGSFVSRDSKVRCASRLNCLSHHQHDYLGFRVVLPGTGSLT
jgi:serine/threonine-protein kinase